MMGYDPLYTSLTRLRNDALARGMEELAIVYGWALMRRGMEILGRAA